MESVLEKMSSAQILGAIGIIVTGVVALTLILSITRYQLRSLESDTALKREKQQGELALRTKVAEQGGPNSERNLEALLTDTTPTPAPRPIADPDVELATRIGVLQVSSDSIERVLELAVASDPARKYAMIAAIDRLQTEDADSEAILATVKALCQPADKSPVLTELS